MTTHLLSFYWPVEKLAWVKGVLFLEEIRYLFQIFYYTPANHFIMHTAKVRERMSNSKNLFCLLMSLLFMQYIIYIHIKLLLNFFSSVCQCWYNNDMTFFFFNCVPICLKHMSNYSYKTLGEQIPQRHLY